MTRRGLEIRLTDEHLAALPPDLRAELQYLAWQTQSVSLPEEQLYTAKAPNPVVHNGEDEAIKMRQAARGEGHELPHLVKQPKTWSQHDEDGQEQGRRQDARPEREAGQAD